MKIKPDPECKYCHGMVYDIVDFGSTTAMLPSFCGCIEEQIPEGYDGILRSFPMILRRSIYSSTTGY